MLWSRVRQLGREACTRSAVLAAWPLASLVATSLCQPVTRPLHLPSPSGSLHFSEPTTFSSHLQHLSHPPTVSVLPGSSHLLPTQHPHRRQGQWRSHPQETPCPPPDMPSASSPSRQRPEHLSVFEGAKDREIMPELTLTPTEGQRVCTTISKVMSTFNTKRPMPTDISLSLQELSMIRKPD